MNRTIVFLFVCASVIALSSCEDNDDPVWGNTRNKYRVTQTTSYEEDVAYARNVFSYQGDKLVSITNYRFDETWGWRERQKQLISYLGDHITVTFETEMPKGSVLRNIRYHYIVRNGLMMKEVWERLYDDSWLTYARWDYQYSGLNLMSWQEYRYYPDSSYYLRGAGTYEYSGGLLTGGSSTYFNTDDDVPYTETFAFEYSGGKLVQYTETYQEEGYYTQTYRVRYSYALNRIVSGNSEYWDGDTQQWEPDWGETVYEYDDQDNLSKIGDEYSEMELEYEPGNGNARFFYIDPTSMLYGAPTLKNGTDAGDAGDAGDYIPYHKRILTHIPQ